MTSFSVLVGATIRIVATAKDAANLPAPVTGASASGSDAAIARVNNASNDGLTQDITGVALGTATVTVTGIASDGNPISTPYQVVVTAPPVPVATHFDFEKVS